MREEIFVNPAWLHARLGDRQVAIVDASWHMPAAARDAQADFTAARIPCAVRFDLDAVSDPASPLPHMLPSAHDFAAAAGALGISEDMKVIVYDTQGLFAAARVRWTFKVFGVRDVLILSGGLPRWRAEGYAIESGPPQSPAKRVFNSVRDRKAVASIEDVERYLKDGSATMVDARPAARFNGEAPEPRVGLRRGHMPGAHNVPADALVSNGAMRPAEELARIFASRGIDVERPVVTTCGSGVTAAIVSLALETLGQPAKALYDGSWAEWGSQTNTARFPSVTEA